MAGNVQCVHMQAKKHNTFGAAILDECTVNRVAPPVTLDSSTTETEMAPPNLPAVLHKKYCY